ncbi:MAG: ribonuclease R family protein [Xenococcaceae cyanobacterium]
MEFSIATLLSHFVDDKLVAGKVLEKKLGCEDEESIFKLQIALDALEKIGVIVKERGKYRRAYEDDVVEAKLRCSSKGFCFAIQDNEGSDDIYVRESHLSNAWNGDRVLVRVIKEGSRRRSPEGEVKVILERANPSLLATVTQTEEGFRAIPLDDRLLFELNLRQNGQNLTEAIDHLVHVTVMRYPIAQNPPIGKVSKVLGSDAEAASDLDIVSCKHDLPQTFSEKVIKATSNLPKDLTKAEIKKRLDLRELLTIAIETDSKLEKNSSIENAFSLEKTDSDAWRVGIHIADVAHYIEPDSALDLEAKKRGTAINLRTKALPLFPEAVIQRTSLVPDRERGAVSVFLTIDDKGQVVEANFEPSVIKVDYLLDYEQIQSLLGDRSKSAPELAKVAEMFEELFFKIAPKVKAQRLQRSCFEITLSERHYLFKDEGRLGAIVADPALPVRSLLTELVVLAGKAVADYLIALGLPGIYCTQSEPDLEELEDLLKLGANLGLDVELSSAEEIKPQDYQLLTQEFAKASASKVLNHLLKASLKSAKYSTHPGFHFGLAYPDAYTRCASPAQRYADLLIQRVLKAVFTEGRDRRHSRVKNAVDLRSSNCYGQINWNVLPTEVQTTLEEQLISVVSHLNEREKLAEDAERDLEGLKKAEKMKERTGKIFEGLITGVQSYGFFVEIEDLLVEGLVHVSSLKDDWYEYRSRHSCLVGRKNRIAYRLGDRVEVEVKSVDYYRQQIDLVTVGGGSAASKEDLEEE